MKLTDQEQVILKATGNGVAEVSRVIKAVGYPKATVKKVLVGLSEKGIIALHRHDWPSSLKPEQRKLMVKIGNNYYSAVSVMRRNPKQSKGKTALKKTGRALKGFAKGALSAGAQILGAGATALNPAKKRKKQAKKNKTVIKAKRVVVLNPKKKPVKRRRNLDHRDSTHQVEVRKHWRAGGLSQWQRAHKAGQHDLFAHGIKARNPKGPIPTPKDVAEYKALFDEYSYWQSHAKSTAEKAFLKKIKSAMNRYEKSRRRVPSSTATITRKKARNASRAIHPKPSKTHRAGASRKNSSKKATAKVRSVAKARKAPTRRASTRAVKRRNPDPKQGSTTKAARLAIAKQTIGSSPVYVFKWMGKWHQSLSEPPHHATGVIILYPDGSVKSQKKNPSAESIRKEFAGSVNGERDLFFPQGTPAGKLAKLGKLVSITTEEGTIKPVSGTAWLCADTRGKLHIGSTSGAPLFDGPKRSFGHVTKLEYESSKPHLGYRGPIIWFHRAGEENGIKPTLHADGKGGLVFKGGDYRLTRRGIEN
jgi:hypothetical protein